MSRQNMSFNQLVDYIDKEQSIDSFSWNLYSHDKQDIIREFEENAQHLKQSRGKVYLYHEVLSLQTNDLSQQEQVKIIRDLTELYILKRADNHLVYGKVHNDTDNIHIHLIISSNKINDNKRVRLAKQEFNNIRQFVEVYKNKKYEKQLEPTLNYQQENTKVKEKRAEQEIKNKRKKQTKKEFVFECVQDSLNSSLSKEAFETSLKNKGLSFYQNGNTIGVTFENKNYRLKTLGLLENYQKVLNKYKKKEQRKAKRQEFKQSKNKTQSRTHWNKNRRIENEKKSKSLQRKRNQKRTREL